MAISQQTASLGAREAIKLDTLIKDYNKKGSDGTISPANINGNINN
jgi:hypothetical protein